MSSAVLYRKAKPAGAMPKATWRRSLTPVGVVLTIACVKCGGEAVLDLKRTHRALKTKTATRAADFDGEEGVRYVVDPAVRCPHDGCTFEDFIELEDYAK